MTIVEVVFKLGKIAVAVGEAIAGAATGKLSPDEAWSRYLDAHADLAAHRAVDEEINVELKDALDKKFGTEDGE